MGHHIMEFTQAVCLFVFWATTLAVLRGLPLALVLRNLFYLAREAICDAGDGTWIGLGLVMSKTLPTVQSLHPLPRQVFKRYRWWYLDCSLGIAQCDPRACMQSRHSTPLSL